MMPTILSGRKREEALRSLCNASNYITTVKRSFKELSPIGKWYFDYIQMELCNAALEIGGIEGCNMVFSSSDIELKNREKNSG